MAAGDAAAHAAGLLPRIAELEALNSKLESRLAQHMRAFAENPMPALLYDPQTLRILQSNRSALALYGYTGESFANLSLLDLFSPEAVAAEPEIVSELRRPSNTLGPFLHLSAAGLELTVTLVSFAIDLEPAQPATDTRVLLISDESSRHNTEEALRTSEERYRELFENANDVIFIHDLKGKIVAVNRAAEYLTGYSRSELLGRNFSDLVAPEARHQTQDSIRAHLGGSATQHYELPIISKFGTRRFLEVSTRIVFQRGTPNAIQGIGRDVTERKLAQQKLIENAQELQLKNEELSTALRLAREATQLKEQFLANTSHELRTPMNGIMGMVNLLRTTELNPDQLEYAEAISTCANDLLTIINDILDLSQIEAGRISLTDEPFDLRESLKAVAKMLRLRAGAKGLDLAYEIDPRVPALVYGDSVRVRQIFTNLIANAIKFTSQGGVRVILKLTQNDKVFSCAVVDSGIGVDDSVRERIFEAFFQADGTTRRRFGGTGLGLTICKQLVEIMGGRIGTYNNNPGPGSTFWFELPFRPAAETMRAVRGENGENQDGETGDVAAAWSGAL